MDYRFNSERTRLIVRGKGTSPNPYRKGSVKVKLDIKGAIVFALVLIVCLTLESVVTLAIG